MMVRLRKKQKEEKSLRKNNSRRELTKEILKGLAMGGLIVASFVLPGLPQIFSLLGINNAKDRYRAKRAIEAVFMVRGARAFDGEVIDELLAVGVEPIVPLDHAW